MILLKSSVKPSVVTSRAKNVARKQQQKPLIKKLSSILPSSVEIIQLMAPITAAIKKSTVSPPNITQKNAATSAAPRDTGRTPDGLQQRLHIPPDGPFDGAVLHGFDMETVVAHPNSDDLFVDVHHR